MTASEFAFLAIGLIVGVACGAALIQVLRSRPPSPRRVQVTVSPNSIPSRRASTLADNAIDRAGPGTAGGPADGSSNETEAEEPDEATRTSVPSHAPFRVAGATASAGSVAVGSDRRSVGISIAQEPDPMVSALRASVAAGRTTAMASQSSAGD